MSYFGHSENKSGQFELLKDHIQSVADRAKKYAKKFGVGEQAYAAGILHDIGKYSDKFQIHLETPEIKAGNHQDVGALLLSCCGGSAGTIAAVVIEGHHGGMKYLPPNRREYSAELFNRMKENPEKYTGSTPDEFVKRFIKDGFKLPEKINGFKVGDSITTTMLDTRMLYSTLVDADFLETEAHFNGTTQTPRKYRGDGPPLDIDKAINALNNYVDEIRKKHSDSPISSIRNYLYNQCTAIANDKTGAFTLSAPTGTGKTLAMLSFALNHAKKNNLSRIILVMPFLNIIEQTAKIYKDIFSVSKGFDPNTVIEHHSLSKNTYQYRHNNIRTIPSGLLVENWDAPIVLTTSLQFFESMMAHKPARCRKLHRIANSMVMFDEVQTLPIHLATITLANLTRLIDRDGPYKSTILFATATQPAYNSLNERIKSYSNKEWKPKEIANDQKRLYAKAAERVTVEWDYQVPKTIDALADEIMGHKQILCITNLKRHAYDLTTLIPDCMHISTSMCVAHRMEVLKKVNEKLDNNEDIRLISTQCVEAGVDIDFPVVFRALAPLEAISQAAGRCNRHGKNGTGLVKVFDLTQTDRRSVYPPGYEAPVSATTSFLNEMAMRNNLNTIEIINNQKC